MFNYNTIFNLLFLVNWSVIVIFVIVMEKFELLKSLLEHLEDYYATKENSKNMDAFVTWMTMQTANGKGIETMATNNRFGTASEQINTSVANLDNGIGILNGLMFRYGRMYAKIALEKATTLSLEEFIFLATLSSFNSLTKTELVTTVVFEKSTGIEIIKRLVATKLMTEEINPNDKRSKLLKVTIKGQKTLHIAINQMSIISKEITATLDLSEKKALHYILSKLEKHHRTNLIANIERLKNQFGA